MLDIIKDGFRATLTSYRDFQGTGLIVALFLFLANSPLCNTIKKTALFFESGLN